MMSDRRTCGGSRYGVAVPDHVAGGSAHDRSLHSAFGLGRSANTDRGNKCQCSDKLLHSSLPLAVP